MDRLEAEGAVGIEAMLDQIEAMVKSANSLEELRAFMHAAFSEIDNNVLSRTLAMAMTSAYAGGMEDVEDDG